jgi:hypothetical protein
VNEIKKNQWSKSAHAANLVYMIQSKPYSIRRALLSLGLCALFQLNVACDDSSGKVTDPDAGHTDLDAGDMDNPNVSSAGQVCMDGWCWENPRPAGNHFVDVLSLGQEAWLVTESGVLLHWDGQNYTVEDLRDVRSIWGAQASELWATDTMGQLHRYDGSRWSAVTEPEVFARHVWGRAADDVWVLGNKVMHWNGTIWTERSPSEPKYWSDIHAISADDAWMVASDGSVAHWDGSTWTATKIGDQNTLLSSVWMSGTDDVWAVGDFMGHIWRFDGTSWQDMGAPLEFPGQQIHAVWGSAPDDVWFGGGPGREGTARLVHWDGQSFNIAQRLDYGDIRQIHGNGPNDFWVVGEHGIVSRFTGEWNRPGVPEPLGKLDLRALAVLPVNGGIQAWTAGAAPLGGDAILRRGAGGWWAREETPSFLENTSSIVALAEDDVWVGLENDDAAFAHWDGSAWSRVTVEGIGGIRSMCSFGSEAWAISGTEFEMGVARYDGSSWQQDASGPKGQVDALSCVGPDEIWAYSLEGSALWVRSSGVWRPVGFGSWSGLRGMMLSANGGSTWALGTQELGSGQDPQLARWDGGDWMGVVLPEDTRIMSISAAGPTILWALGEDGLHRIEGDVVTRVAEGLGFSNSAHIHALSSTEALIVGRGLETRRWNGSIYQTLAEAGEGGAEDVWFADENAGYAVNDGIWRWDGSAWTQDLEDGRYLSAVWGFGPGEAVAVGSRSAVLRTGGTWTELSVDGLDSVENLVGVWGSSSNDIWAIGDRGAVLRHTGAGFEAVEGASASSWRSVIGRSATDIDFLGVGSNGEVIVYHFDGSTLSPRRLPAQPVAIQGVEGTVHLVERNGSIWERGSNGFIQTYEGQENTELTGAAFASSDNIYAIDSRNLVHWDGNAWSAVEALKDVWWFDEGAIISSGGQIYVVSVLGTILRLER